MTRWWRRGFFIVGFLLAFASGLASATLPLVLGVVMVLLSLLPTRADPAPEPTASGGPLVEAEGHTWMQQPDGSWLRWNAVDRSWEDVGPPPPEVVRDHTATAPTPKSPTSKILAVVSALLVAAVLWALLDPMAQIPGVSPVVCSVKGGTWHDGSSVIVPAGCYPREP